MIKIGDFAKNFKINVKTLYFYEKQKILLPAEVDRWTGYRYYNNDSITKLSQILYLKKLGFSLKEIKNFSEEKIEAKTQDIKKQIESLYKNLSDLTSLTKNKKGEISMKTFINDERVVGRWVKIGMVKNKEQFLAEKIQKEEKIFPFKELYFLPNGEKYWVIKWTKGSVNIKDRDYSYEIINNKMLIAITDAKDNTISDFAVYEQADNKKYSKEDIKIVDNMDIPFVEDKNLVGFWEEIDIIKDKDKFNPNKKNWKDIEIVKGYDFRPDGTGSIIFKNNNIFMIKWSKNVILDERLMTASEYIIKDIDGEKYLIVEWKSGDYTYGGKINCYYVFKKTKFL